MSDRGLIYTSHFGLETLPFENVPDPAFFFGQGDYTRVFEHLTACFRAGRGLMVVAGPIGSGKTTLSQKIMFSIPEGNQLIWMAEPPESSNDFFLLLAQELGCEIPPSLSRSFILHNVREHLFDLFKQGRRCLTIVDEVHKISDEVLEGVRLLNNLEYGANKLMQLLLLGQEEFLSRLAQPELSSFHQRIAALEVLGKMEPDAVREYILHRLNVAKGRPDIFSEEAVDAIANVTGGVPRVTNSLCDRTLRAGCAHGKQQVDVDDVKEAVRELGDAGVDRKLFFYLLDKRHSKSTSQTISPAMAERPAFSPEPVVADGTEFERPAVRTQPEFTRMPLLDEPVTSPPSIHLARPPRGAMAPYGRRRVARSGIALPLIGLVASIFLFAGSLWFYCEHTDQGEGRCLENLFGFLS